MTDYSQQLIARPELKQIQPYQNTPRYINHQAYEDKLAILVCLIKIWKADAPDFFSIPSADSALTIRECESIEVADTAKELINKATVKFARGTVIHNIYSSSKSVAPVDNIENADIIKNVIKSTNDGDLTTTDTLRYNGSDKTSTTSMAAKYDDKGLIDFNRTAQEPALLRPQDVAIGNRIEIRCGYAYSEKEFKEMNKSDGDNLDLVFTGFITSISVDTPLELECTNMAHVLTTISTPYISEKDTLTVKDFLDDDGKYHLLKGTGISLAASSVKSDIIVKGGTITDNLTVADVLTEWSKSGVLCIMENKSDGTSVLKVGLTYYADKINRALPNNNKKYITYNGGIQSIPIIQFDWDVVQDKLSLTRNDKKYLAVEASGRTADHQFFKLTIRKEPNRDDEGWAVDSEGQFDIINERKLKPRKKLKFVEGTHSDRRIEGHLSNKVDLRKYNVVHYFSTKIGITRKELIEEAKQFWAAYTPNGISGSLVIFGDLFVKPTDIVGLVDMRQPEKNGYYYVETVNTTFGLDGYRRELKMPFKIASFTQQVEFIK